MDENIVRGYHAAGELLGIGRQRVWEYRRDYLSFPRGRLVMHIREWDREELLDWHRRYNAGEFRRHERVTVRQAFDEGLEVRLFDIPVKIIETLGSRAYKLTLADGSLHVVQGHSKVEVSA